MASEEPKQVTLRHRSGTFPGFDDSLVGNREGFERLKVAIDEALESHSGESGAAIGDIVGVHCWSDEDIAATAREPTRTETATGCFYGLLMVLVFSSGYCRARILALREDRLGVIQSWNVRIWTPPPVASELTDDE